MNIPAFRFVIIHLLALAQVVGQRGDDPPELIVRQPMQLTQEEQTEDWCEWVRVLNPDEWMSCLWGDQEGVLWVGTSKGRVLALRQDTWTLEVDIRSQITGVAVDSTNRVWLSTGNGIRSLERQDNDRWKVTPYLTYYQGRPGLVSGGYGPGFDAKRLWGHVEGIYVPPLKSAYAPFVISTEHGLFSWAGFHEVWHHFLPHYWGANSAWLDTRTLLPHRRPTSVVEDRAGNLWLGTDGDGIVRFNAHAREYCERDPENNQGDHTEFTSFGPDDLGCEFTVVQALVASDDPQAVWCLVSGSDRESRLAHFDGQVWTTLSLEEKANCLEELKSHVALVGLDKGNLSLAGVDIAAKKVDRLQAPDGPGHPIVHIVRTKDERLFCATRWKLYENLQSR